MTIYGFKFPSDGHICIQNMNSSSWSKQKMTQVHRIRLFDYIPSSIVSLSLNGESEKGNLLVGRSNGYVEIWNIYEDVFLQASFNVTQDNFLSSVAWCRYKNQLAIVVSLYSGELILYEYPSLKIHNLISGAGDSIIALTVNKSQDKIAIACTNGDSTGYVSVFSTKDDWSFVSKSDDFISEVISVCFDGNDNIYAGTSLGKIGRIDAETGRLLMTYDATMGSSPCKVWALTSVPGGFASGDSRGHVMIWDALTATVVSSFESHQAPILALAANSLYLWAAGEDPTIATFKYSKNSRSWSKIGNRARVHDHNVTALVAAPGEKQHFISGSVDTTFFSGKKIFPFQAQPAISSSLRYELNTSSEEEKDTTDVLSNPYATPANGYGSLIVCGASGDHQLVVWRLNGTDGAKQELMLKTKAESNRIECVALRPGATEIAYSATCLKILRFNSNGQWEFDRDFQYNLDGVSSLAYSNSGKLYVGFWNGVHSLSVLLLARRSNDADNENESDDSDSKFIYKPYNVGFPVLKISVSCNGKYVAVGGFENILVLNGDLTERVCRVPSFGKSPFSTFAFQPFKNRIFIATGGDKIYCYNVLKQQHLLKIKLKFNGEGAAVNAISFNPDAPHQILLSSSKKAIVKNLKKNELNAYRLPYTDVLYVTYAPNKQIIVFEKPWIFIVSSIPDAYKPKRFLKNDEEATPRY